MKNCGHAADKDLNYHWRDKNRIIKRETENPKLLKGLRW